MTHRICLLTSLSIALSGTMALTAHAAPVTIFHDTFESSDTVTSTKLVDGIEAGELNWYRSLNPSALAVVDDSFAGGGSLRALSFSDTDPFRRFGASFTSTTLGANVGDRIVLTFDTRISSFEEDTNVAGYRFGLYNSNDTNITSDSPNGNNQPTQENDDFGYYVRLAVQTTDAPDLMREPAGNNPVGGDANVDGTTEITTGGSTTAVGLNDLLKHSIQFDLERTSTGISLALYFDGDLVASAIDNTPLTTTFDKIYFGQGNVDSHFLVDNVKLQTIAIPEPASLALMGLGGLMMLGGRRRTA